MAKKIKGITIEIDGNTAPLAKALKDMNVNINATNKELRELDKLLKLDPKNTQLLSQKQEVLAESIEKSKKKLDSLTSAQEQMTQKFEKGEIDQGQYREFQREILKTEQKLGSLNEKYAENETQLKNSQKSQSEFSKSLSGTGENADKLNKTVSKYSKVIGTLGGVLAGLSVKNFTDFEESLAKVSTIADTVAKPIGQIKDEVIDLSNKVGISAKDLNDALYQTISAGVDTGSSIETLGIAASLSKAGFSDITTSVDGLTSVLNAYSLESEQADEIANKFLITQNKGKTTVDELAKSIGKIAPIASASGLSTDELLSSIASLTTQGIGTYEAVSGLKAAISNMIKPSKQASDIAKELGIDFSTSAIKSKGWAGVLDEIKSAVSQVSPEYANLSESLKETDDKIKSLTDSGGQNTVAMTELKNQKNLLTQQMDLLAGSTDSEISKMAGLFGSVEGLNAMLALTSEGGMTISQNLLNLVMNANPIAVITSLIVGLVVAFVTLWNKAEAFRKFWVDLWEGIKSVFWSIANPIKDFISNLFGGGKSREIKLINEQRYIGTPNMSKAISGFNGRFSEVTRGIPVLNSNYNNSRIVTINNTINTRGDDIDFERLADKINRILGRRL